MKTLVTYTLEAEEIKSIIAMHLVGKGIAVASKDIRLVTIAREDWYGHQLNPDIYAEVPSQQDLK